MINYIELSCSFVPPYPASEIAVVWLSELGYESFVEEENVLKAYIPENSFNKDELNTLVSRFKDQDINCEFAITQIPAQNWNQVWEESFEPVLMPNLSIVAPFHGQEFRKNRVIEIEPKMSFGTGHHQTTYLMCSAMESLDLQNKEVLDMGTGTGILAINAIQLGAKHVTAVDIEAWSVENTIENATRNKILSICAIEGDIDCVTESNFEVILANINRNVLMNHMSAYAKLLISGGKLLLSGFFITDVPDLVEFSERYSFKLITKYDKENWACLLLEKI